VEAGGGEVVEPHAAEVLVWTDHDDPDGLAATIEANAERLAWVQLPWAGVEPLIGVIDDRRLFTCGKGVYADPVAEHGLALLLAGFRHLAGYSRLASWGPQHGRNLLGAKVTILGGGGITGSLLRLLDPFGCDITVVRNRPAPVEGADRVLGWEEHQAAIEGADALVLALALTPTTAGAIDAATLDLLHEHSWVINLARGAHIVTDDLVAALAAGRIGGAGLDVTDPEPLPDGHPLWSEPRCIITPHVGNTEAMAIPLLSARISTNLRRWAEGAELIGTVDPALGY